MGYRSVSATTSSSELIEKRTVPRCLWLVWLAVACSVLTTSLDLPLRYWLVCAPVALLCACNVRGTAWSLRTGALLLLSGLFLNGAVIVANGAMPFSERAAAIAGVSASYVSAPPSSRAVLEPGTDLGVLADVVPVPGLAWVISAGDIVAAAGLLTVILGGVLANLSRRPRAVPSAGTPDPGEEAGDVRGDTHR